MAEHYVHHDEGDRREEVHVVQDAGYEHQQRIVEDRAVERHAVMVRLTQFFWLLFGILEALIGLRIVLKFIAANPSSPFAQLVYGVTDLFLWPFFGLTATPAAGGMVLEIPSIIAMIVYALLAWVVVKVLWLVLYQPSSRTVSTYEREDRIR